MTGHGKTSWQSYRNGVSFPLEDRIIHLMGDQHRVKHSTRKLARLVIAHVRVATQHEYVEKQVELEMAKEELEDVVRQFLKMFEDGSMFPKSSVNIGNNSPLVNRMRALLKEDEA